MWSIHFCSPNVHAQHSRIILWTLLQRRWRRISLVQSLRKILSLLSWRIAFSHIMLLRFRFVLYNTVSYNLFSKNCRCRHLIARSRAQFTFAVAIASSAGSLCCCSLSRVQPVRQSASNTNLNYYVYKLYLYSNLNVICLLTRLFVDNYFEFKLFFFLINN